MRKNKSVLNVVIFLLQFFVINVCSSQETNIKITPLQNPFTADYIKENLKPSKPRLIYNEQLLTELKGKINSDPVIGNIYNAVHFAAYRILDIPVIKRVKTTNSILDISRELLRRINMLGLVYLVERNSVILDRINKEVLATCDFSDWNPPAYLDVAEIAMAVSLALDWTLDDLPDSTIQKAKRALIEKGIYPSWEEYGGNKNNAWWVNHYNNWNQVCNGGMIAASISIAEDDPLLAAKTLKRALNSIPYVLAVDYAPEGVCPEGVGYWDYATSYALLSTSMLETSFGTDCGYRKYPGFIKSADFKWMCSNTPSGWYYNFADCPDKPRTDGDILLAWFAAETGKSMYYEKEKFLTPAKEMNLSYMTGAALSWMCKYKERIKDTPPAVWVGRGKTPVAVFRGTNNNSDYYFAAKGGCGAVSHGNMDAGSFIFELNGVRWSVDPGTQDYLIGEQGFDLWRQCQECQRWELLTKNNFGHSTVTVNNDRHIVNGYALLKKYKKGRKPEVTFNLTPTFKGYLKSAIRKFTKNSDRSLLIEDKIKTCPETKLITWQLITQADVKIINGGVILSQNGKQLLVKNLSQPTVAFDVISLEPPPHRLDKHISNLKRIELRIPVSPDKMDTTFDINIQLAEKSE